MHALWDRWVFDESHSQHAQTALAAVSVVRVGLVCGNGRVDVHVFGAGDESMQMLSNGRASMRGPIFSSKATLPCAVKEAQEDFPRACACSVPVLAYALAPVRTRAEGELSSSSMSQQFRRSGCGC